MELGHAPRGRDEGRTLIEVSDYLGQYLDAVTARSRTDALAVARRAVLDGMTPVDVACEILVPAQREVGERWLRNEFTVADEHIATAIAESVLESVTRDTAKPDADAPLAVLACPEGEVHSFGLRIAAEVLRHEGINVLFLGATIPTEHLLRLIEQVKPSWLGLSVSLPLNLPSARRVVQAVRSSSPDLPIVIGGRVASLNGAGLAPLASDLVVADVRDLRLKEVTR